MTGRSASVLAARAAIGGILVGVPAALILIAGDPLPTWAQWSAIVHLEPDWGNTVLLASVLPCLTWIAWALFAYPLIGELLRHLLGRPVLPVGVLLRGQQQAAAALVAAALLSNSPALAPPSAAPVPTLHVTDVRTVAAHARPDAIHTPIRDAEAASRPTQSTTSAVTPYEVRRGDTLWTIAERRLGNGADYPAIVDESADIVQPGGRHLTDPGLILPGWQLDIPAAAQASPHTPPTASPTPPGQDSPSPRTPSIVATPAPVPSSGTGTESAVPRTDPDAAEAGRPRGEPVVPVAIGGGVAAILAAGLVTAITRRRRRMRAERRYGERTPLPTEGSARDAEMRLRAVSDPEAVAALHRALTAVLATARQDVAPLPSLVAVRVDENDITIYLHEPATPPAPFRPLFTDGTAWTAPRDAFTVPVEPYSRAPYPALVTVGTDLGGGILLLDLEQQGQLSVTSPDPATARSMLNAITVELASTPWGDDIHLSLVGIPDDLPMELDPYRIHHVADTATLVRDLRTHLADRRAALDAEEISTIRLARIHLAEIESWAPFVAVIGAPPTPDEQNELDDLIRQHTGTGLVIVTLHPTAAAATIKLADTVAEFHGNDATLPPLPFIPQLLDELALEQTLQLFTETAAPAEHVHREMPDLDRANPVALAVPIDTAATPIEQAEIADGAATPSPTVPKTSPVFSTGLHPAATDTARPAPHLRLLGQVEVEHVDRAKLFPGRGAELLAYLLTARQPVAGAQIQKALWPTSYDRTNGNLRSLAKQVRAALGHDPDGDLWLPEGRGNAGFTTHPAIRSDWQDFTDLTGPDPAAVPIEQLATALRLVRGQPLLGTDGHRGRWAWRAPLEETIIATIHDAAIALSEKAVANGDRSGIKLAIRAARFADPLSELSWQIELRAIATSATPAQVEQIVADLYATAGYGNTDYEPDAETVALIRIARRAAKGNRP